MQRQTNFYPPSGRPGWSPPKKEALELLYLAWGWRRYRETPQQISTREGWLYFTPRRGSSILALPHQEISTRVGELIILHPDCECGFDNAPGAIVEVCTWVWRSESQWKALRPPRGEYLKLELHADLAKRVRDLHDRTRLEVQSSDEYSQVALSLLRQQIDLSLVRSLSERPQPASDQQRLDLAARWIDQNLPNHHLVTGLSDYLRLSPTTLNRLFQRCLGMNVRTYAKEARLRRARQLIHEGRSVKEAAFMLGYRFPNDLSRAFQGVR